jgi:UDP-N-acetylmuramate-alanine ligase
VRVVKELDQVVPELVAMLQPGDAVLTLGAGSIGTLPQRLVDALRQKGTAA